MIVARYRDGDVTVWSDGTVTVSADEPEKTRVEKLFREPVEVARSSTEDDGAIIEISERVLPGSPGHARSVIRSLPDNRITFDNGDTDVAI